MATQTPKHPGSPAYRFMSGETFSGKTAEDLLPERLQSILGDPASAQGTVTMPAAFMVALLERHAVPDDMAADFVSFLYDALCRRDNPHSYTMWIEWDV